MEVSGRTARRPRHAEIGGEVSGRSRLTGSDIQPPPCRVCERTGKTNDADTFCLECNDHMCTNCARTHRRSRTFNQHQLLDKSQMPRKVINVRQMCDAHPDTLIEYYCKKQDQLLCRHCITLDHQGCQDDYLISTVCSYVKDSSEFKQMYQGLIEIENNLSQYKSKLEDNLTTIENNRHNAKRDIDNFKKELYLFVDRMVDDMHEEVEGILNTNEGAMAIIREECDMVAAEVKDMFIELDIRNKSKQEMQLFIAMKTSQQVTELLGYTMKSIDEQNRVWNYRFEPDEQLREVVESVQKLGHLSEEREADIQSTPPGHVAIQGEADIQSTPPGHVAIQGEADIQSTPPGHVAVQHTKAVPERTKIRNTMELPSKVDIDKRDCCITGIANVDDDRLVISDNSNKSVKMLSRRNKQVIHHLKLPYQPCDITQMSKDILAVTCPDGQYIQLVAVAQSGSLSLGRQIQVDGACMGIQYSRAGGDNMVVSFVDPGKVKVINMSGTVLKDLLPDSAGIQQWSWPQYVAFSPDGQSVFVSDLQNATVTGISMDGRVVFTYRDDQLRSPTGLAVGDDGVIYICDAGTHNIHMVSSAGRKIKILIGENDGVRDPCGIMYSSKDHKLYVGMDDNSVQEFSLI